MTLESADNSQNNISEFLTHLHKAFSQVNLYTINHPLAQAATQNSFTVLSQILKDAKELTITITGDKHILLNGTFC